jgi:Tol biopolymer transport system component/DNA-binding winged helix-turn-helix (wHTH) protein
MSILLKVNGWIVDYDKNTLTKDSTTINIEPLAMDTLVFFAKNQGDVISREQLINEVWKGKVVGDHAIYRIVNLLRKTLQTDASQPLLVTIRKKGYQLVAPVERLNAPVKQQEHHAEITPTEQTKFELSSGNNNRYGNRVKLSLIAAFIAVIVLLIVFKTTTVDQNDAIQPFTHSKPFTNLAGEEKDPIYSNNGEWIAFSHQPVNKPFWHIYVKSTKENASEPAHQLTEGDFSDRSPTWSPDGLQLAFVRYVDGNCAIMSIPFNTSEIAQPKFVTDCGGRPGHNDLAWSADGKSLLFSSARSDIEPAKIYSYSLETGRLNQLTNSATVKGKGDLTLSISPSGDKLVFLRDTNWGNTEIYLMDLTTYQTEKLFENIGWLSSISWSKDGSLIYYIGDFNELLAYSLKNKTHHVIARNIQSLNSPTSSPAKQQIAVITGQSAIDIWVQSLEPSLTNGKLGKPFIQSSAIDYFPVFANHSDRVAFVSLRTGDVQIWIREENGKEFPISNFTDGRTVKRLQWSPDDKYLLSDFKNQIYMLNIETGTTRKLLPDDRSITAEAASWSKNGESIYFSSDIDGDWQIYRIPVKNNGSIEQITQRGGYSAQESNDGNSVYYLKYHKPGLWRFSFKDQQEEIIVEDIDVFSYNGWYIRDKSIYYISNNAKAPGVYRVTPGIEKKRLVSIESIIRSFALSPDEKKVIYPKVFRSESSIILLSP